MFQAGLLLFIRRSTRCKQQLV